MLEIKTVIVKILRNFSVELGVEHFEPKLNFVGMMKSENGIKLKFKKRLN